MPEWLNNTIFDSVTWMSLLTAVLILIITLVAVRIASTQLRRLFKEKIAREKLELMVKIVKYGIFLISVLWILSVLGVELSGLVVAGGVVAIAVGFASQSIIGNLISGLFLMGERPVKIGDFVEISGNLGVVEDISVISTTITTLDGVSIRIPNEAVFTSSIKNYNSYVVRRFEYRIGISYTDDADLAKRIITGIADDHPLVLVNPAPHIYVDDLADNSVDIVVRLWATSAEWWTVRTELLWKIKIALDEAGITIPLPQRTLWFGNDKANLNSADNSRK